VGIIIYISNAYLTLVEMTENAQYILDYLLARGWTKEAICGMLGNMQSESTINPGIWENLDYGNQEGGFGIVQWTPAEKYLEWAYINELPLENMDSQLTRILVEVDLNNQWINPDMLFVEYTQLTGSPYDLAMLFLTSYERPLDSNQPIRGEQAMYWYATLVGGKKRKGMSIVLMAGMRR